MGTELTTNGIENDFTFGSKYFSLCVSILQNTSRNGMGLRLAYFQVSITGGQGTEFKTLQSLQRY